MSAHSLTPRNFVKSECPLCRNGGNEIEAVVLSLVVPHEIVGEFPLRTHAEIDLLPTLKLVEVPPELGFGNHNPLAVGRRVVPKVAKAAERAEAFGKLDAPHLGELKSVERPGTIVAVLEVILPQSLYGESAREVSRMPIPRTTGEHGMLESGGIPSVLIAVQSAVIFHMECPLLVFRDIKLTGDFPIGSGHAVALVVNVGEQIGAAPCVGLEHLHGSGHARPVAEVVVERMSEVVVQLHVLGRCSYCCCYEGKG